MALCCVFVAALGNYALSRSRTLLRPLKLTVQSLVDLCEELELPAVLHPATLPFTADDSGAREPADVQVLQLLYHAIRARINRVCTTTFTRCIELRRLRFPLGAVCGWVWIVVAFGG
jgi:hypothetical protein